jgi:hypothetical protein
MAVLLLVNDAFDEFVPMAVAVDTNATISAIAATALDGRNQIEPRLRWLMSTIFVPEPLFSFGVI